MLVTCGDTPYLARTLTAIGRQSRAPQRLVIVDTAHPDRPCGSGHPLNEVAAATLDTDAIPTRVVAAPGSRTFGAAVAVGLDLNAEANQRAAERIRARTGEIPAVRAGDVAWLWLLHDDSAPDTHALAELLKEVELATSVALAGCKQRDWADPDRLLEVGINATSSTRRFIETDAEEIDQGQLDHRSDVFGVGLAGALIRRDVWTSLGGTDPALGPFNDGLELSRRVRLAGYRVVVVPEAVIYHAQASYRGIRFESESRAPNVARSFGPRRRAQLHTWISGVPTWKVPFVYLAIAVLTPLRALWRLAEKDFDLMFAELGAGAQILTRPGPWLATRRRTEETRRVPRATLASIYTPRSAISAKKRELRRSEADARKAALAPSELELAELAAIATKRRWALAFLALLAFGLGIAAVRPPVGIGVYEGGALLRASGSLAETYRAATSGWIDVGLGHRGPADPFLFALLPALLVTGDLSVLVPLAYWLAVPVAGLGAWFAAGAGTRSVLVRGWATLTWALAPAFVPALHGGALGGALAHVALPWMILGLVRAVGAQRTDVVESGMVGARRIDRQQARSRSGEYRGTPGASAATDTESTTHMGAGLGAEALEADDAPAEHAARAAALAAGSPHPRVGAGSSAAVPARRARGTIAAGAGAAIAFAFATAGAPVLLPTGIVLLWIAQLFIPRHRLVFLLVPAPALVLHIPRLYALATEHLAALAVTSPGLVGPVSTGSLRDALLSVFTAPPAGAIGPVPLALLARGAGAIPLLFALLALARRGAVGRAVRLGWLVVLGAAAALVAVRDVVVAVVDGTDHTASTGPLVSLLLAGLLIAAVAGADGLGAKLSARSFGLGHVAGALAFVLAILTPAAWATTWIVSAPNAMQVRAATDVPTPALARQLAAGSGAERTLLIAPTAGGVLSADVVRTDGATMLTSASVLAVRQAYEGADPAKDWLRTVLARLAGGSDDSVVGELASAGIGVVVVPPARQLDADVQPRRYTELLAALDASPGLARVTQNDSGTIWRVDTENDGGTLAARARLETASTTIEVASERGRVSDHIGPSDGERLLVLAERADAAWSARLGDAPLTADRDEWRQAFVVPANEGDLRVTYRAPYEPWFSIALVVTATLTALLAIPRRRSRRDP